MKRIYKWDNEINNGRVRMKYYIISSKQKSLGQESYVNTVKRVCYRPMEQNWDIALE